MSKNSKPLEHHMRRDFQFLTVKSSGKLQSNCTHMFDSDGLYGKVYEKLSFTEKNCNFKKPGQPESVICAPHMKNCFSVITI